MHHFFVSAVTQTFLSSHSLLLLGCGVGFFETGGRQSYSEASSCLSSRTVLQGSPSSLGGWVFFALSNKVDQRHFVAWFSCLSYQKRETLCCFAERESAVFDFWRSRNGISASFAATSPGTGHLIFP